MLRSLQAVFRCSQLIPPTFLKAAAVLSTPAACHSTNPKYFNAKEPYEEFRARFLNAFNDKTLDGWWLRHWLQNLHIEDAVPPPEVVISALHACRRLNDIALAIRFLECVKYKCSIVKGAWEWMQKEIEATMKELGIPSLAQLGYEKPELAWVHHDED